VGFEDGGGVRDVALDNGDVGFRGQRLCPAYIATEGEDLKWCLTSDKGFSYSSALLSRGPGYQDLSKT